MDDFQIYGGGETKRQDQSEKEEEVRKVELDDERTLMLKLLLRKRNGSCGLRLMFECACMNVCASKKREKRGESVRETEEGREEKE